MLSGKKNMSYWQKTGSVYSKRNSHGLLVGDKLAQPFEKAAESLSTDIDQTHILPETLHLGVWAQ